MSHFCRKLTEYLNMLKILTDLNIQLAVKFYS